MTLEKTTWADALIHPFALAPQIEGVGQDNLAKLARTATDSLYQWEI